MEFKLIIKKLNGNLSNKEEKIFDAWYSEKDAHKHYFDNVSANYGKELKEIDVELGWKQLMARIDANKPKTNFHKYAAAAVIVVLLGLVYMLNQPKFLDDDSLPIVVDSSIEAGTDKATLTLEDGGVILLEKGKTFANDNARSNGEKLIYASSNKLDDKKEIAYNYLTVPRGGEFYLELEDGTRVWLNSDSKLKYPVEFIKGEKRVVELIYGEAYFDVSSSVNHDGSKFAAISPLQEVEVLGTEFNIRAYQNENSVYTTLIEGKVAVENKSGSAFLVPNQQSEVSTDSEKILVEEVDVFNETSWKQGVFSFNNKPLGEILKSLARWYDVDVVVEAEEISEIKFNGVFRKDQELQEILNQIMISNSNDFAYEIKNNTVILK